MPYKLNPVTGNLDYYIADGPQGPAGEDGVGVIAGGTTGQTLAKASNTDYDMTWSSSGAGDMIAATYDPNTVAGDAFDTDNHTSGTTNKVYTATEQTKLSGIEELADVTDTANVTSAGALMDSEVTNLAQVKAFDSADYATAAQGATADSALQDIVDDLTPTLGGELDAAGNNIIDLGDVTFKTGATGGTLRTGTSVADKFELQAYDVNGGAYQKVLEVDAGNDPTLEVFSETFRIWDSTDETKQLQLDTSAISTGTTRTLTYPDANVNLGDIATNNAKLTANTTNVTAAGAVMDSEVTNLAQVKAFDSSDYIPSTEDPTGDIVGTTDTQTLTNKTINPSSNTITGINSTGSIAINKSSVTNGALDVDGDIYSNGEKVVSNSVVDDFAAIDMASPSAMRGLGTGRFAVLGSGGTSNLPGGGGGLLEVFVADLGLASQYYIFRYYVVSTTSSAVDAYISTCSDTTTGTLSWKLIS